MSHSTITACVTIQGLSAYSPSRRYDYEVPKIEGESPENYDIRTWRHHCHVSRENGNVVIPGNQFHLCLREGAKHTGLKVAGSRGATWTARFQSGIAVTEDIDLHVKPDEVEMIAIQAHSDGKVKGNGSRVTRRFPQIYDWEATFNVTIFDPTITEDIFRKVVDEAGMFVGLGRWAPRSAQCGYNGRFKLTNLVWNPDRQEVQTAKPETFRGRKAA